MKKLLILLLLLILPSCIEVTEKPYNPEIFTEYILQCKRDTLYYYKVVNMMGKVPVIDSVYEAKEYRANIDKYIY